MSHTVTTAIGWSDHSDAGQAGYDAAVNALEQVLPRHPKLALVFASSWFDQAALLNGIHAVLKHVPLAGASTAGEIGPKGPASHSCLIVLFASPSLACGVGMAEDIARNPREAGQQSALAALRGLPAGSRAGLLFFADGLIASAADATRGMQEVLGTSSLIVGGLAGDDLQFSRTHQYCNARAASRSIVSVLFGGAVKLGVGIEHGFAPISKPRRITRAAADRLYELDRQPAASVYEEYFGRDTVQQLEREGLTRQRLAYPLGIRRETAGHWLLRNVVAFESDGSLRCTGNLVEGAWLQLMISSRELTLDAARKAAQQAIQPLSRVACVLVFSAAVRKILLGAEQAAAEIACIRRVVGPGPVVAGCYTYGECAPLASDAGHEPLAAQTGSVLVLALGDS